MSPKATVLTALLLAFLPVVAPAQIGVTSPNQPEGGLSETIEADEGQVSGGPLDIAQLLVNEGRVVEAVEIVGRLGSGEDEVWRPFTVDLAIRPGFHLNPNPAPDPVLIATAISGVVGSVRHVRYPAADPTEGEPPGYRGRVRIEGEVEHRGGGAAAVEVVYQACDDRRCLPPVSRVVRLG